LQAVRPDFDLSIFCCCHAGAVAGVPAAKNEADHVAKQLKFGRMIYRQNNS
jgi:hypothetical protein